MIATKNGSIRQSMRISIEPSDVAKLNRQIASFVQKYGVNELTFRVNNVKRQYAKLRKSERRMNLANVAYEKARTTFEQNTNRYDAWMDDDDD